MGRRGEPRAARLGSAWAFVLGGAGAAFLARGPGRTACVRLLPFLLSRSSPPPPRSGFPPGPRGAGARLRRAPEGRGEEEEREKVATPASTAKSPAVVAGPRRRHVAEGGGAGTWRRLRVLRPIVPS